MKPSKPITKEELARAEEVKTAITKEHDSGRTDDLSGVTDVNELIGLDLDACQPSIDDTIAEIRALMLSALGRGYPKPEVLNSAISSAWLDGLCTGLMVVKLREEEVSDESKPTPPYPWCMHPDECTPKGYCQRNPSCGD